MRLLAEFFFVLWKKRIIFAGNITVWSVQHENLLYNYEKNNLCNYIDDAFDIMCG